MKPKPIPLKKVSLPLVFVDCRQEVKNRSALYSLGGSCWSEPSYFMESNGFDGYKPTNSITAITTKKKKGFEKNPIRTVKAAALRTPLAD